MLRSLWVTARLVVSIAIIAAIVAQLDSSISFANRNGRSEAANVVINYLSYFTIDSNSLTVMILVATAIRFARGEVSETSRLSVTRAAITTYMVITGVVYNVLLRASLPQGATVAWSNEILHVLGPVYLLLDWLLAPGRHALRWRDGLPALAFPTVWVIYTLVRGPLAHDPYTHANHWYPYPFLNPITSTGGYVTVTANILGIAAAVTLVALGLTWTSRRGRPPATNSDASA